MLTPGPVGRQTRSSVRLGKCYDRVMCEVPSQPKGGGDVHSVGVVVQLAR